jgi:peptidoglycan-associated lipoprotein
MQKPSSAVSSGNISPAIVGPSKDTKEVYIIGGLVLIMAIAIGVFWFYSQDLMVSWANGSNGQLTDNQVSTILKKQGATSPLSEPIVHNQIVPASNYKSDSIHTDIYFEVGRKGLTDEAKSILATQAEILKKDADLGLLVQGYTDQQGSAGYNKKLGLMRAETVKEHLIGLGVSDQAITVVSLGKEGVLCIDNSDVCRHMNRRVHLEMRKIGQEHMAGIDASTKAEETSSPTENLLPPNLEATPGS